MEGGETTMLCFNSVRLIFVAEESDYIKPFCLRVEIRSFKGNFDFNEGFYDVHRTNIKRENSLFPYLTIR